MRHDARTAVQRLGRGIVGELGKQGEGFVALDARGGDQQIVARPDAVPLVRPIAQRQRARAGLRQGHGVRQRPAQPVGGALLFQSADVPENRHTCCTCCAVLCGVVRVF